MEKKYVGIDAHQSSLVIEIQEGNGRVVMQTILPVETARSRNFFRTLERPVEVTFEEGNLAGWLSDVIEPLVDQVIVCNLRNNKLIDNGNKRDQIDAHKLAELLRLNRLTPVYHGGGRIRLLRELFHAYENLWTIRSG